MSKRKTRGLDQEPVPKIPARIHVLESVVGSVDDALILFGAATWAQLWAMSQVAQAGGVLAIPPGKVLRVDAWLVDASEDAERVAVARQGPRSGDDFDVMHLDAERLPKGVGRG